jgi:hypothetical protein
MSGTVLLMLVGFGVLGTLAYIHDPRHRRDGEVKGPPIRSEHVAIALYAAIGALGGLLVGYVAARPFGGLAYWLSNYGDGWLWAAMGAFVGAAVKFLRQRGL